MQREKDNEINDFNSRANWHRPVVGENQKPVWNDRCQEVKLDFALAEVRAQKDI